ncbi:MAG: DoxX family protein [Bdellovibrionales bacterium GWA2_49_15]|nr:MAG: DoxX family protein [Bdellovibrionales bacterium GWA2_49_15]HAZ13509.1 DoxX family protein [Bdellovibrionales bacterium]
MINDLGLLFLRVGASALMILGHGLPKILEFGQNAQSFPDPLNVGSKASLILAIFGEAVCPLFVALGLKTRYASVPPLITMLVAAFIVHAGDSWNKMEFPLTYALLFFVIMFLGSGRFSADHLFFKRG